MRRAEEVKEEEPAPVRQAPVRPPAPVPGHPPAPLRQAEETSSEESGMTAPAELVLVRDRYMGGGRIIATPTFFPSFWQKDT